MSKQKMPLEIGSNYFFFKTIEALTYFFVLKSHILPSPIKPRARWDSWEKSPLDPKVPFSGIKGKISLLKASINFSIVVTEIPLCPFDKVLILQANTIRV